MRGGAVRGRGARWPAACLPWALVGALLAGLWLAPPCEVPSGSMRETLLPGDHVLVARWEYGLTLPFTRLALPGLRRPRRGDVVVFHAPRGTEGEYVKRCVATGGQTIQILDKRVVVDGDTLEEPYARHSDRAVRAAGLDPRDNLGPLTLGPGELFVMGDDRDDSDDSRFWGPLPADQVLGRAWRVYWSWDAERGRVRWGRLLRRVR